jgi:hypothetical protein
MCAATDRPVWVALLTYTACLYWGLVGQQPAYSVEKLEIADAANFRQKPIRSCNAVDGRR